MRYRNIARQPAENMGVEMQLGKVEMEKRAFPWESPNVLMMFFNQSACHNPLRDVPLTLKSS